MASFDSDNVPLFVILWVIAGRLVKTVKRFSPRERKVYEMFR